MLKDDLLGWSLKWRCFFPQLFLLASQLSKFYLFQGVLNLSHSTVFCANFSKSADRSAVLTPNIMKIEMSINFIITNVLHSNFQRQLITSTSFQISFGRHFQSNLMNSRAKMNLISVKISKKLDLKIIYVILFCLNETNL